MDSAEKAPSSSPNKPKQQQVLKPQNAVVSLEVAASSPDDDDHRRPSSRIRASILPGASALLLLLLLPWPIYLLFIFTGLSSYNPELQITKMSISDFKINPDFPHQLSGNFTIDFSLRNPLSSRIKHRRTKKIQASVFFKKNLVFSTGLASDDDFMLSKGCETSFEASVFLVLSSPGEIVEDAMMNKALSFDVILRITDLSDHDMVFSCEHTDLQLITNSEFLLEHSNNCSCSPRGIVN